LLVLWHFLLIASPGVDAQDEESLLVSMRKRQVDVETMLSKGVAYEGASGLIMPYDSGNQSVSPQQLDLLKQENEDRVKLYRLITAQQPSEKTFEQTGRERAVRQLPRLVDGILREDPTTGAIIDRWPMAQFSATYWLTSLFDSLDRKERLLKKNQQIIEAAPQIGKTPEHKILLRMEQRLADVVELKRAAKLSETEGGMIGADSESELSGKAQRLIEQENADRLELFRIIGKRSKPSISAQEVGRIRASERFRKGLG
jgi:hypothetical protein